MRAQRGGNLFKFCLTLLLFITMKEINTIVHPHYFPWNNIKKSTRKHRRWSKGRPNNWNKLVNLLDIQKLLSSSYSYWSFKNNSIWEETDNQKYLGSVPRPPPFFVFVRMTYLRADIMWIAFSFKKSADGWLMPSYRKMLKGIWSTVSLVRNRILVPSFKQIFQYFLQFPELGWLCPPMYLLGFLWTLLLEPSEKFIFCLHKCYSISGFIFILNFNKYCS